MYSSLKQSSLFKSKIGFTCHHPIIEIIRLKLNSMATDSSDRILHMCLENLFCNTHTCTNTLTHCLSTPSTLYLGN